MVNNSWVPYGVTDFASPLSKAVDRAKRQNEEDLRNKLEQSRQIKEADPNVKNLKIATGVIDLVGTLGKLKKDPATSKAEDATTTKNLYAKYFSNDKNREILDNALKFATEEGKVKLRSKEFKRFIRDLKLQKVTEENQDDHPTLAIGANIHDHKMLDYLLDSDASELIRIKKNRVAFEVSQATNIYSNIKNGLSEEDAKADAARLSGKPEDIKKDFIDNISSNLSKLGISEELIASIGGFTSLSEQGDTLAAQGGASYNIERSSKLVVKQQNDYDTARSQFNIDPNSLSRTLSEHIIEDSNEGISTAKAKVNQTAKLALQIDNGSLDSHELAGMQTGWVEHEGGNIIVTEKNKHLYPGFEPSDDPKKPTKLAKGSILLNEGQWTLLNNRMKARYARITAAADATRNQALNTAIGMASANQLTEEAKERALIAYEASGGDTKSEEYKQLSRLNLNHQSPEYYQVELDEINAKIQNGKIEDVMSNIDNIQNVTLRKEFEKKKEQYDIALKNLNSQSDTSFMGYGKDKINDRNKLNLVTGQDLPPGSMRTAQAYIANIKQRVFTEEFFRPGAQPQDPGFNQIVSERVEFALDQLGINKKWDDDGRGILTPNHTGEFPLLQVHVGSDREIGGSSLKHTGDELAAMLRSKNITGPGKNYTDRLLNTPNAVLSNGELVATARFGWDGEKFTGYPKDVLLKAEILGIQPSVLVSRQIKALKNSKDDDAKKIIELYNLDSLVDVLKDQKDVELRDLIENSDDKDLLHYYERLGLNNFTPNHFKRLMKLEDRFDAKINPEKRKKDIQERLSALDKLNPK